MKTRTYCFTLAILTLMLTVTQSVAELSFAELAGTYVGKRTETLPEDTRRYDEIIVIEADGTLTNYVYLNGEWVWTSSGTLEIRAAGDYWLEFEYGIITLRGAHLEATFHFPELGATVHFQGHRVKESPRIP